MTQYPRRTSSTDLSDDELLLFDLLFDEYAVFRQLSRDQYRIHMNCTYNHGLDDSALKTTLESLLARDLITIRKTNSSTKDDRFSLSPLGGKFWEMERNPDWNRYVRWWQSDSRLTVMSPRSEICLLLIGGKFASGMIEPMGRPRQRTVYNHFIVPWKRFSPTFVARLKIGGKPLDTFSADFDTFEMSRQWWQDVHELETLSNGFR